LEVRILKNDLLGGALVEDLYRALEGIKGI